MKLYVGGICQGQAELARQENPNAYIICDFQEEIRKAIESGQDAREFASEIAASHPDAVVVANEVGSGVVPIEAGERAFREAVGRALCVIAQKSETVTRAVCGIGVRIK